EQEKARRAAKRLEAKEREEIGPLFASQVQPVDVDALRVQRRLRHSKQWERGEELRGNQYVLGILDEIALVNLAARHIGPAVLAKLVECRRRTSPPAVEYGLQFWKGVLTGKKVLLEVRVTGQRQTPYGVMNNIEEVCFPPEGWEPPWTEEQARAWTWAKCK